MFTKYYDFKSYTVFVRGKKVKVKAANADIRDGILYFYSAQSFGSVIHIFKEFDGYRIDL